MRFLFYLFFLVILNAAEEHGESSSEKHEEKRTADLENGKPFVPIGPFKVCIVKNGDVKGYLMIQINLLVSKDEDYENVKILSPRFQNHFIIYLSHILHNLWIKGEEPNLIQLKSFLKKCTTDVMGNSDVIKDILFKSYFYAKEEDQKKSF